MTKELRETLKSLSFFFIFISKTHKKQSINLKKEGEIMQIDLFNVKEFVEINHLKEVTSPVLFQRGDVPDPNGLVSNEIFGVTTKSRKETFAYINLYGHFFHPHIYKAIRRMFRNIDRIVDGSQFYSIDDNGYLVIDEVAGDTGLEWLYENWDKIKWERKDESGKSMRDERISMLENFKKDEIFMPYQIVIPAFYRDVLTNSGGGGGTTDDINNLYTKVIRLVATIRSQGMFDFQFNSTNYTIQQTLVDIYDYFKQKIEKKKGIIRKYLMGKNTDYGVRTVITSASYHANKPDELFVDFEHSAIPISQLCSLVYPFITSYIKKFFERELFDNKNQKILYNPATDEIDKVVSLKNPESYFSDKWIKQMIDTFIRDPESRFNKIEVPVGKGNQKLYLAFAGKRMDGSNTSELSGTVNRPMTWTDLLYLACADTVKDKHALITRYPLLDEFGIFVSKIRVSSTVNTVPMLINGELYKWYPNIRFDIPPEKIGAYFIDACQFSNSYLEGIEGD